MAKKVFHFFLSDASSFTYHRIIVTFINIFRARVAKTIGNTAVPHTAWLSIDSFEEVLAWFPSSTGAGGSAYTTIEDVIEYTISTGKGDIFMWRIQIKQAASFQLCSIWSHSGS
jgi:hypothetical protein